MKKCEYCGIENEDDATKCRQCGGRQIRFYEGISLRGKVALLLLILSMVYLLSPFDILPFSFFDDLVIVIVGFSVWIVLTLKEKRR